MSPNFSRQGGSALAVAVFIIVVMALLVAGLAALLNRQSGTVVYEVWGTRAYLAAESGLQGGLVRLYPLNGSGLSSCFSSYQQAFSSSGLNGCSVTVSCTLASSSDADMPKVARVRSQASCQTGRITTGRTLSVEVSE
ncbi:type II secretory pathway component [Gallaecimonas mangrovi]|uniref:type II secretory pathway component n=1 Tax=Gallaecimonas mangrovi TaxID=2291597 RepID=UPI000E20B77B|nr:type II secretory pathway component [Gallaecimonas mangrovi]